MCHDSAKSSGRSPVWIMSQRVIRRCGRPRRQLQPDGVAVRRAHLRGDRGDSLITLLVFCGQIIRSYFYLMATCSYLQTNFTTFRNIFPFSLDSTLNILRNINNDIVFIPEIFTIIAYRNNETSFQYLNRLIHFVFFFFIETNVYKSSNKSYSPIQQFINNFITRVQDSVVCNHIWHKRWINNKTQSAADL